MTSVKVFIPSQGIWSQSIYGLDKEFFVESLIKSRFMDSRFCTNGRINYDGTWMTLHENLNIPMKGLELDFCPIIYSDILDVCYYCSDTFRDEDTGQVKEITMKTRDRDRATEIRTSVIFDKVNINPRTILVSVKLLKGLITHLDKSYKYLIPLIEKIKELGNICSDTSDDYTLLLKFDEK